MFNYIQSELVRYAQKKSIYVFYGVIFLGVILLLFLMIGLDRGRNVDSAIQILAMCLNLALPVVGVRLILDVFGDDLQSHVLGNSLSTSLTRGQLLVGKFISLVIYSILSMIVMFFIYLVIYVILLGNLNELNMVFTPSMVGIIFGLWAKLVVYTMMCSILCYLFNKATGAITFYILIATALIPNLLVLGLGALSQQALNVYNKLSLFANSSNLLGTLNYQIDYLYVIVLMVGYLALSIVASYVILKYKDIEVS